LRNNRAPDSLAKSPRRWWLFVLWALSVNLVNLWFVKPVVRQLDVVGVLLVMVAAVLWMVSLPRRQRKVWIGFTLYGLLVGQGIGRLHTAGLAGEIPLGIVAVVCLLLLAWAYTRMPLITLLLSAVFVVVLALMPWFRSAKPEGRGVEAVGAALIVVWIGVSWLLHQRGGKQVTEG